MLSQLACFSRAYPVNTLNKFSRLKMVKIVREFSSRVTPLRIISKIYNNIRDPA